MTYLITFTCYGCHLHGDPEGSVDRKHNHFGGRLMEPDARMVAAEMALMKQPPYSLDEARRKVVLSSIIERCLANAWHLLAAHVRTTHVHIVIESLRTPDRIMNDLKSFASRRSGFRRKR